MASNALVLDVWNTADKSTPMGTIKIALRDVAPALIPPLGIYRAWGQVSWTVFLLEQLHYHPHLGRNLSHLGRSIFRNWNAVVVNAIARLDTALAEHRVEGAAPIRIKGNAVTQVMDNPLTGHSNPMQQQKMYHPDSPCRVAAKESPDIYLSCMIFFCVVGRSAIFSLCTVFYIHLYGQYDRGLHCYTGERDVQEINPASIYNLAFRRIPALKWYLHDHYTVSSS